AARPDRASRLGQWALRTAMLALAVAAIGLTLARYDLIPKLTGFSTLLAGGLLSLLALLVGIAGLLAGRKVSPRPARHGLAAVAVSLVYLGFLATRPLAAGDAPAIHDVTTDLANPPQFEVLPLRADNLAGVGTGENWRKIHARAYGDLAPVI
ncbi:MAG TPA: hypothetical protein PKE25_13830, partial [Novosphingobium sp.]|nr:hypothetical protein [Novosphingobium sp.]